MNMDYLDDGFGQEDDYGYDMADEESIVNSILRNNKRYARPVSALDLGDLRWNPALVKKGHVCHVQLDVNLGQSVKRRVLAAQGSKLKVQIAAPASIWANAEFVREAFRLGVLPMSLRFENGRWTVRSFGSVAELIASERIALDAGTFATLSSFALTVALRARKTHDKGKRFEEFLVLLFSQVKGFYVLKNRYITKTEEIDLVIKNTMAADSAWPSSPIIVVSAKNQATPVGVPALTGLHGNIIKRGGECRIGFLCAAKDVAWSSVQTDLLRFSITGPVMVVLDGKMLKELTNESVDVSQRVALAIADACLN